MIDPTVAAAVLRDAVAPALLILPKHMDTPQARVMILACGGQESRLTQRAQQTDQPGVKGPARGLWQFEQGTSWSHGGVWGLYLHRDTNELLRACCRERGCSFDPAVIWGRLEFDDVMAAACARMLLWTDPAPLPAISDTDGAWDYYQRLWRPGKPHPETWGECHAAAVGAVTGAPDHPPEDDL